MMVLPYISHRYTRVPSNLNIPPGSHRALALGTPFSFKKKLIQTESKSTNIYQAINHPHHNLKGSIINILPLQMWKLSFR